MADSIAAFAQAESWLPRLLRRLDVIPLVYRDLAGAFEAETSTMIDRLLVPYVLVAVIALASCAVFDVFMYPALVGPLFVVRALLISSCILRW